MARSSHRPPTSNPITPAHMANSNNKDHMVVATTDTTNRIQTWATTINNKEVILLP